MRSVMPASQPGSVGVVWERGGGQLSYTAAIVIATLMSNHPNSAFSQSGGIGTVRSLWRGSSAIDVTIIRQRIAVLQRSAVIIADNDNSTKCFVGSHLLLFCRDFPTTFHHLSVPIAIFSITHSLTISIKSSLYTHCP